MNQRAVSERAKDSKSDTATTLVLLCGKLAEMGNGLDLTDLKRWLQERDPSAHVEIVADLCNQPKALTKEIDPHPGTAVLGLCSGDRDGPEFQYHARKAGFDPLGIEMIRLGSYCVLPHSRPLGTNKAKLLLAAAVARARAFPGSGPEHVKPHLLRSGQRVSRRALFTLPPISYEPVAAIRRDRCASETGCALCVDRCPRDALTIANGQVIVNKSSCDACGLCVAACPRSAAELPGASLAQFEAELTELLLLQAQAGEATAVVFICERNASALEGLASAGLSYPASWMPVVVPCAGMVSAGWLLQTLANGAAAVAVVPCGSTCPFDQQEHTEGQASYCQELIRLLGGDPGTVRILSTSPNELAEGLNRPFPENHRDGIVDPPAVLLREPVATAQALKMLSQAYGTTDLVVLSHPHSALGVVRINAEACTGCEACSRACPTAALTSGQQDGDMILTFDPAMCNACGTCIQPCPESAIHAERTTDLEMLANGAVRLYADTEARCERCGAAFAPSAMVRRVEDLLSADNGSRADALAATVRRCPSCRGLGLAARTQQ